MATQTITTNTNVDSIAFRSNDTLVINNGAIVTVNTNQTKFWSSITINNGKLRIENTGTTNSIRFTTGRVSAALAQTITPTSGLGTIEVEGNWIDVGSGDGTANKELTIPYTDYVPALWVQTASGSSTYEIWLNVSGVYGGSLSKFIDGFNSVGTGARGKFFIQKPNTVQDTFIILTGATTVNTSRQITLSSTNGIFVGASITGTNIPANSVVETIDDVTHVTINAACTANGTVTVTICNPFSSQLLPTVVFGNGTNGNILGNGINVRIPNIMLTSDTPANLQTLSATVGMSMTMTNGGIISLKTCLLDEVYNVFTQAQIATIENVGITIPPAITECYDLTINNVGYGLPPVRRYVTASGWFQRDIRDTQVPIDANYINDAVLNNLVIVTNLSTTAAGTAVAPVGIIRLGYSNNVSCKNCRLYELQQYSSGHCGIAINAPVTNSIFEDIEIYGCKPIGIYLASNNIFRRITFSLNMFNSNFGWVAGSRFGFNPNTGNDLIDNTQYYFKTRNYFTRDRLIYTESQEFSSTPYLGDVTFPDYFTCYCNADTSVSLGWGQRDPTHNAPSYEIYRDTSLPITIDDAHKIFSTNTKATLTFVNAGVKPVVTSSAGRTITFNSSKTITASSGDFISDGFLVGDRLMIVGGNAGASGTKNNGHYTIANVATTVITVNEGLYTESAWGAGTNLTVTLTATHTTNKGAITATASRTLTFNSNKTITAGGASAGSFIRDGYVVGDVITISGTTANNKTATISVLTATVMTVLETLTTETTYTANATIIGRPIVNDTRYYYLLRKYNSAGVYFDSAPQEVWVHNPINIYTQRLLQSEVLGTTWTTSNATVGTNVANSPTSLPSATAANQLTADSITAIATNGYITQTVSTIIGNSYTFSTLVATLATAALPSTSVVGRIRLGTAITTFNATPAWQRVSVTFVATATSTVAEIQVDVNGQKIIVSGSIVNDGTTPKPPFQTTTLVQANAVDVAFINLLRPYSSSGGGETNNSGIEYSYGSSPTGSMFFEIYCSTVQGFTPSLANRIMGGGTALNIISLSTNCIGNVFDTITQVGRAYEAGAINTLALALGCSNNKFLNFTLDMGYNFNTNLISPATMSNDNLCHNWDVGGYRNYVANNPIYTLNTASGLILQNIRLNRSDIPISNSILNVVIKGLSGANARPAGNATTYALGSTINGIAVAYTAVYDTIFNELYFTDTTGCLHLLFNASSKEIKPYILIGTAQYTNLGRLQLINAGDGVILTYPHKIMGVTGFRNLAPLLNGVDLGTTSTLLEGLKKEYSINGGEYKLATTANLSGETVSKYGFDFSVKLTAMAGMKYNTQTTQFVLGETIEGETSLARATVIGDFSTGTLWLSGITGTFTATEYIRLYGGARRARNVATNSVALFPSFSSYIDGLQIYTNIDKTVLYPSNVDPITVKIVSPSLVPIEGAIILVTVSESTVDYNIGDVLLEGYTNALGELSSEIPLTANVNVSIRVRKSTTGALYKSSDNPNTISFGSGLYATIVMIPDV